MTDPGFLPVRFPEGQGDVVLGLHPIGRVHVSRGRYVFTPRPGTFPMLTVVPAAGCTGASLRWLKARIAAAAEDGGVALLARLRRLERLRGDGDGE